MMLIFSLLFTIFIIRPFPCESLKCYECSGPTPCGQGKTDFHVDCSGKCIVYRNQYDGGNIVRRCCPSDCGTEDGLRTYEGRNPVYFCSTDMCNGALSDLKLLGEIIDQLTTTSVSLTTNDVSSEEQSSSLSCYDCTGYNPACGITESTLVHGCQSCMVYLNVFDGIIRRCCKSGCGSSGTISNYDGRTAYFCSSNRCNGIGAERVLTGEGVLSSTTTIATSTQITTIQSSFSCYECSGLNDQQCITTTSNCPMCMIYRSDNDPTKFDRRCCWWGCGSPNQVTDFAGRPTYFCNSDYCNGPGREAILGYLTTSSSTTLATTRKSSYQCYDCSGSECGSQGSSLSMNCPTCMVYRNPDDRTRIERRCCWWGCGPSNSISTYNGIQTYFCTGDKCNGYGAENILGPSITTATTNPITTSLTTPSTTTTYSSSTCSLNCQNGGTPEIEDGCFCYCLENINGRECENIDCTRADSDAETCSPENRSLCEESVTFAYECVHLCGKC